MNNNTDISFTDLIFSLYGSNNDSPMMITYVVQILKQCEEHGVYDSLSDMMIERTIWYKAFTPIFTRFNLSKDKIDELLLNAI